jgi:hypothetical protein
VHQLFERGTYFVTASTLLVPNPYDQPNCLYRNNRDGTFSRVASGPMSTDGGDSSAGVWADFDNDGDLDLFIAKRNLADFGRARATWRGGLRESGGSKSVADVGLG